MSGASRVNRWWFAAAVAAVLLAVLAWQCRPEALRSRLQAAIQQQFQRPVQLGQLRFVWRDGDSLASAQAGARLEVLLNRVDLPAYEGHRGLTIDQLSFLLRPAPRAWWRAWRDAAPWPVDVVEARGLATAPLPGALDDGLGRWEFSMVRLEGVVADATTPRSAGLQLRGVWRRAVGDGFREIPVAGQFRDLAVSLPQQEAPGLSLEQAHVVAGRLDFSVARLVASPSSMKFEMALEPVNLREALPGLGIAVPTTRDARAFTRFSLRGTCHGDATGMGCSELELALDETRLQGSAVRTEGVATESGRPAIWRLQLHADQLNLDRYLPPDDPREPPFAVPWSKADAWPVEAELVVDRLWLGGLRFRGARLSVRAGEHGLATR